VEEWEVVSFAPRRYRRRDGKNERTKGKETNLKKRDEESGRGFKAFK
jgi:hypothetical protein